MTETNARLTGYPFGGVAPRANRMPKAELLRRERALGLAPMFEELPKRHLRAIACHW